MPYYLWREKTLVIYEVRSKSRMNIKHCAKFNQRGIEGLGPSPQENPNESVLQQGREARIANKLFVERLYSGFERAGHVVTSGIGDVR
jgi:hypothetical protein